MASKNSLRHCSLFHGLGEDVLSHLESHMRWRELMADELLCSQGDKPMGLYVVASGRLLVYELLYNGQELTLSTMVAGSFTGELSVIDLQPRTATIKAQVLSSVGLLPQAVASDLFFKEPLLAQRLMVFLTRKVREMTSQRVLLGIPNTFNRVCAWLEYKVQTSQSGFEVVAGLPRQQDLASILNTSRESVSRAMACLLREGVIRKTSGGIQILKRDLLQHWAHKDSHPV